MHVGGWEAVGCVCVLVFVYVSILCLFFVVTCCVGMSLFLFVCLYFVFVCFICVCIRTYMPMYSFFLSVGSCFIAQIRTQHISFKRYSPRPK